MINNLPAETYPAYVGGVFATPATPRPRLQTIVHLFESDDGLWYQGLEVEIGYSMIREQAVEGQAWCWQYDLRPRVVRVLRYIHSPDGYGTPNMKTEVPDPHEHAIWNSRGEWTLRKRFEEVDAAIREQL